MLSCLRRLSFSPGPVVLTGIIAPLSAIHTLPSLASERFAASAPMYKATDQGALGSWSPDSRSGLAPAIFFFYPKQASCPAHPLASCLLPSVPLRELAV